MSVIKHKVIDVIILNLAGLVDDAVAGLVQVLIHETLPFCIGKDCVV